MGEGEEGRGKSGVGVMEGGGRWWYVFFKEGEAVHGSTLQEATL